MKFQSTFFKKARRDLSTHLLLFLSAFLPPCLAQSTPPPPAVFVADAAARPFADRIEALGTLRANERVDLTATVSERVTFIGFEDGDRVKKGRVLLKLYSEEEEALLNEARSSATEARKQFDRISQLAATGASSASQLDQSRREYETANARKTAIESRLSNLVITAPFDGVVGLRNISLGAVLRPGDVITTLDDDSKMFLDFQVPLRFLPQLAIGSRIEARTAGVKDRAFAGNIRSISSRVDPVTRSVTVRAEIPNDDRFLRPGMLMMVDIKANERDAVFIPEGALLPLGKKIRVLVIEQRGEQTAAVSREITTGARVRGEVEVLEGLAAGEKVVTDGAFKVPPGSIVRVLASDAAGSSLTDKLQSAGAAK